MTSIEIINDYLILLGCSMADATLLARWMNK